LAQGQFKLDALEALMADLPGDQRENLQSALGANATAIPLIDVVPAAALQNFSGSPLEKQLNTWKASPILHHRILLFVTALRTHIENPSKLPELKRSNAARVALGHILTQLREEHAMPLVDTLRRVGITPVRPGS
jgi:hypothetical protein